MDDRLSRLYMTLMLVIAAVITVHAPLTVWIGIWLPDAALGLKAWKEIMMILAVPLAAMTIYQTRRSIDWRHDRLLWAAAAYASIHVVSLVIWNGWLPVVAGLMIDLRYVLYFVLVYVLLRACPRYRQLFARVFAVGAVIVIGFACLQLFLPADILSHIGYGDQTIRPYTTIDQNHDFIRYNSTLRGPNPLGAYAAAVVVILVSLMTAQLRRLQDWRWVAAFGLSLVALYVSYSRSAQLAACVGIAVVLVIRFGRQRWLWVAAAVVMALGSIGLLTLNHYRPTFVANVILHENPEEGNDINSNDGHTDSLRDGTARMLEQPLGAGVGSTGSASLYSGSGQIIENQYLMIAHEVGWLGLLLFLLLFGMIMRRLWARRYEPLALGAFVSGLALGLIGLLLPVWADDTVSILWWGLAAVMLGPQLVEHPLSLAKKVAKSTK